VTGPEAPHVQGDRGATDSELPAAVQPDEVLSRAAERPDIVLRYGGHVDALVDVFAPISLGEPRRPAPLVVFFHGGFWRQQFDRTHVYPLADALRRRGWAVALPEYRRTGGQGGWPQTADDADAALAAVPRMLAEVAPGAVDPTAPVVVGGHSAGGYLALWAGLRSRPGAVSSVVALAPVTDLRYAARVRMGDSAVQALLGSEPDEAPATYEAADVVRLLPADVDVTIIQGTADADVPVDMNRQLGARLAAGGPVAYVELAGVDHFALIDPLSVVFDEVVVPALASA
jgi:acetyl esterase/lipase